MPHSKTTPTFIPKDQFIQYLDHYANHFMINPVFCTEFPVMSKEKIYLGMVLVKFLPVKVVDGLLVMLGPLTIKISTGKSAVIDVGTAHKVKTGEIKVVKGLLSIRGSEVLFTNGKSYHFDAIVFATGYKSTTNTCCDQIGRLKCMWTCISWDGGCLSNEEGLPKQRFPKHWKGMNGVYCAGLARRGLHGVPMDAQNIANDIKEQINTVANDSRLFSV
ncbi:putative indole-3-pyruvate monooxygenase [Dioscorea sansibarensis]